MHVLTVLVEKFESTAYPRLRRGSTPEETLQFLMEQNGLTPKDMYGMLGGRSHTSEILRGKRKISVRQAGLLGKRFNVAPAIFLSFD